MSTINEINYEAYYLDYLEGNLDEVLTAELLVFLAQHPELEVDLEDTSLLVEDIPPLKDQFKHDLKMVDFDHEAIHWNNADAFLIADLEGELSAEKQQELNVFVAKNPGLQSEQRYYKQTRLKADNQLVFENKSSLKKKAVVFSLTRFVAIAASFIGFIFVLSLFFRSGDSPSQIADSKKKPATSKEVDDQEKNHEIYNNSSIEQQVALEEKKAVKPFILPKKKLSQDKKQEDKIELKLNPTHSETDSLPVKTNSAPGSINNKEVNPLYLNQDSGTEILVDNALPSTADYAVVDFKAMNNPYSPITSRLSDLIHTDLDIRMAKPTEQQSGGFYLKIGKLEISRRKY
jgi:hypothetical protein